MDNIIHNNHKKSLGGYVVKILVLFLLCIILLLSCIKLFKKYHHAVQVKNEYEREQQTLIYKKAELEQSIERLSHPEGIEYEVRERYRVVKPGEELILVIDNKQPTESVETTGFWNNLLETVLFWK